jgi:signal transduction histidine kinase
MGKTIDNFLTSGHEFTGNDNLQKFRFSMLNSLLVIAALFSFVNYFAFIFKYIVLTPIYAKAVLAFALVCFCIIYLLRIRKNLYPIAVIIILVSALSLFFFALITSVQDEFRLIWFFLTLFVGFILMGKKYGLLLMLLILASIYYIEHSSGLGLSKLAMFTFSNSFLIFTAFAYFYLQKIERDSLEFKLLNDKLESKITQEIQQRKEQEQMLLRQCRMANMGEMMDSIAHQWRQPLMHINSILMNMDNALEAKKNRKDYLGNKIDEVASLTTHMSQTIEDFRNLFKAEKEKTQFALNIVIADVLTLMKNGFNNIDVIFNAKGNITILGYRSELIQVIIILLSNAVEALDKSNTQNKKIEITTEASDDSAVISIEDNGGGISLENIVNIFDPYFTTKDQSGGTGLGLYIARIIVEHKMSGKITACNTGVGARFTIMLSKDIS